jgi:hypothetical protein
MRFGCPMHRDGFITKEEVSELGWRRWGQPRVDIWPDGRTRSYFHPRKGDKHTVTASRKKAGHRVCRWRTQGSGGTRRAARAMDQWTRYG